MKTELPEPGEYYRLKRARELRGRAAWLESLLRGGNRLLLVVVVMVPLDALQATVLQILTSPLRLSPLVLTSLFLGGNGLLILALRELVTPFVTRRAGRL